MALLSRTMAREAVAAGVELDARKRASRRQTGRWAAQPGPGAPGRESAAVTELRGLAELRAEGILTEEEFTASKRRVLGI